MSENVSDIEGLNAFLETFILNLLPQILILTSKFRIIGI